MEYNSCLASLPEWCKKALRSSPIQYKVALEKISLLDLQILSNFIQNISDIGVSGFGYRCFWNNGDTSILALNEDWHNLVKDKEFEKLNLAFIKEEGKCN